jgi:hypothetical protein
MYAEQQISQTGCFQAGLLILLIPQSRNQIRSRGKRKLLREVWVHTARRTFRSPPPAVREPMSTSGGFLFRLRSSHTTTPARGHGTATRLAEPFNCFAEQNFL